MIQERDRFRENLSRLEGEKKSNNFGKYEKDRMKAEMDKVWNMMTILIRAHTVWEFTII